jgi:cyclic lactone autoinducer peptide
MNMLLKLISKLIKRVAYSGAGLASAGFTYQPKTPEKLISKE